MSYTLSLDFQTGGGWVDYSSSLKTDPKSLLIPVQRQRSIHNKQKCTTNTAQFSLSRDSTLLQAIAAAVKPIKVKILKDGADHFMGFIRPTFTINVGPVRANEIKIECVDQWYFLKYAKASAPVSYFGCKVCDTADKAHSILHQLFYGAGFLDAQLSLTTIATVIPAFSMKIAETYQPVIEQMLFEYGYAAPIDASGIVQMYALGPTSVTPSATLASTVNIVDSYTLTRTESEYEGVDVSYYEAITKTGVTIFNDTTGAKDGLAMYKALADGEYYPTNATASIVATANYSVDNYTLIAATNVSALVKETVGTVNTLDYTPGAQSAAIRLQASGVAAITKLQITGDAIVQGDQHTYSHDWNGGTNRIETIASKYIFDAITADTLSQVRANWLQYSANQYAIKTTRMATAPGEYVQIVDSLLGISQVARVVAVQDGIAPGYVSITAEAFAAVVLVAPIQSRVETSQAGDSTSMIAMQMVAMADDGVITPQEKGAIALRWQDINGDGSTTGSYWATRVAELAFGVPTAEIDSARNALANVLFGSGGILDPATIDSNVPVQSATFYALWSTYYATESRAQSSISRYASIYSSMHVYDCGTYDGTASVDIAELQCGSYDLPGASPDSTTDCGTSDGTTPDVVDLGSYDLTPPATVDYGGYITPSSAYIPPTLTIDCGTIP